MVGWSDVLDWDRNRLEGQTEIYRSERGKWIQGARDAQAALDKIASSGQGVDAAKASLKRRIGTLDKRIADISELMMATAQAADGVWKVQTKVQECKQFAKINELSIRSDGSVETSITGSYTSMPVSGIGQSTTYTTTNEKEGKELETMIKKALALADSVDARYAARMKAVAEGTYSSPETHNSKSPGLYDLPQKGWGPTEVAAWWKALSPEEKQDLINRHPDEIGNLNGIDMASRSQANKILLPKKINQLEKEVQELEKDIQEKENENRNTVIERDDLEWANKKLDDLKKIETNLKENEEEMKEAKAEGKKNIPAPRGLVYLDTSAKYDRVKVAISTGDPDHAKHVATVLPGMDNVPSEDIDGHVGNAERVRNQAIKNSDLEDRDVATIAWMYDTPQGIQEAASSKHASGAAPEIRSALEGLQASRMSSGAGDAHMSLLGHSYGSMTAGKVTALAREGVIDDLVMYGSPGSGVQDVREYNLSQGKAYVSGVNNNDEVQGVGPDDTFGKDPMKMNGITHLANNSENDSKIYSWNPFSRHSEYLEKDTSSLADISRVVGGRADKIVGEK